VKIIGLTTTSVHVNRRGDWLFVHLQTDEGLQGLGEASHGGGVGGDGRVRRLLEEHCRPLLVGRDPQAVVAGIAALQPLAQGRPGATAVSACEQALWDLAGKALGTPVHRLFGGPVRTRIPLYANINRATAERTPAAFAANAAAAAAEGFRAVKCAPFDGLPRERLYQPDGQEFLRRGLACVAAVRQAIGPELTLLVDCHSRFDLATARSVARELLALGVTWLEEPVPTDDLPALRQVAASLGEPELAGVELIGGEALYGLAGFWPYLREGLWRVVMPDVKHCGGIAAALAIAQAASAGGAALSPHNPSGPVATATRAPPEAVVPQVRHLEYAWGEVPWRADLVQPPERIEHGELLLPEGPGLGVALNEAAVAAQRSA
jgi:galactonate dehydratase